MVGGLLGVGVALTVAPVAAHAATASAALTIGVDNVTPSPCTEAPTGTLPPVCHNFTYDDYFPNGVTTPTLTVHSGDVVGFAMSGGSQDALHTVTFEKTGEVPTQTLAAYPLAVPDPVTGTDAGDDPGQLQFNPSLFSPTSLTCGSSAANPCVYDGTSDLNSGALLPGTPPTYVEVSATVGTAVHFMCLIHPGMQGVLNVVATSTATTTQADANAWSTATYTTETAEALARENALETAGASHTTDSHGVSNWNVTAGADGLASDGSPDPFVQLLEMLPSVVNIKPGDTVTWNSPSNFEPHTVTFPHSEGLTLGSKYDFAPQVCETSTGDVPAAGPPPTFGCAGPPFSPSGFEVHLNLAPLGGHSITTTVTQSTSGAISSFPLGPGAPVTSTTYSFPNQNSFSYQCTIHDNMYGVINVIGSPGYRELGADGGIFNFGSSSFQGSAGSIKLNKPVVGGAATPDGGGYWEVASDGGVFTYGDAKFYGSTGSIKLNSPIVGMAATPDGGGYWLFAADGGVFNYGDAGFFGSAGSIKLNKPVVAGMASPDGLGYLMVASDGGVFTYGNSQFLGSTGSIKLNKPVVGIAGTPSGGGYFLVASDGGIFNYGDALFFGSTGSIKLNKPIVGLTTSIDAKGYNLVASDGGVFNYGDTSFVGGMGGSHLNSPIVALTR
ncbi:MAG TPA: hypothetical protein VFW71_08165 [Actinomycetota bacterium]|nr:hypothetical protein [Actinomycetota bacterium]